MPEINRDNFAGYPKDAKSLSQRGYEILLRRCQEAETELAELLFTKDTYLYLIEVLKEMPEVLPQVIAKANSDEFKARFTEAGEQ